MKSLLFPQGRVAITSQLKKEEARYLMVLESGADAVQLRMIQERMVGLQAQLMRANNGGIEGSKGFY
ncbi:MAG: hypothetical protein K0Q66_304 [Chitinophagaceae bacterium]|jgi:hypothetical protein|nr:hypothetical protein [Chitinophagaceae bacterium]